MADHRVRAQSPDGDCVCGHQGPRGCTHSRAWFLAIPHGSARSKPSSINVSALCKGSFHQWAWVRDVRIGSRSCRRCEVAWTSFQLCTQLSALGPRDILWGYAQRCRPWQQLQAALPWTGAAQAKQLLVLHTGALGAALLR